jgi:hypothetical protein
MTRERLTTVAVVVGCGMAAVGAFCALAFGSLVGLVAAVAGAVVCVWAEETP